MGSRPARTNARRGFDEVSSASAAPSTGVDSHERGSRSCESTFAARSARDEPEPNDSPESRNSASRRVAAAARAAVSPSMDSGSTISDDASRSASVSDASASASASEASKSSANA